jgi:hypothetical protein
MPRQSSFSASKIQVKTWAALSEIGATNVSPYIDIFFVSDVGVGGSEWYSDGTRWRAVGGQVVVHNGGGTASGNVTSSTKLLATPIIRAVQAGDQLLCQAVVIKSGVSYTTTLNWNIGSSNTSNSSTLVYNSNTGVNIYQGVYQIHSQQITLKIDSNTSISLIGNQSQQSGFGSGSGIQTPVTNSAGTHLTNGIYVGIWGNMSFGTTETLTVTNLTVTLITCG